MRIAILTNPRSGSAEGAKRSIDDLKTTHHTSIFEAADCEDAKHIANRISIEGTDYFIVVGGDGTINAAINGLYPHIDKTCLVLLPAGTGNDLARTLAIPFDPKEALSLLQSPHERRLDLMEVKIGDEITYGINAAAGGFTGQVDEAMSEDIKKTWGPLGYLIGAAKVLPDLTDYITTIQYDGGPAEKINAMNIVVANGRTIGGGKRVAPLADPEDGLLDVVIVRYGNMAQLTGVAARLLTGNYLENENVLHRRASTVTVRSKPGMWFNVDGELLTKEPITFRVLPKKVRILVGPDYKKEGT